MKHPHFTSGFGHDVQFLFFLEGNQKTIPSRSNFSSHERFSNDLCIDQIYWALTWR